LLFAAGVVICCHRFAFARPPMRRVRPNSFNGKATAKISRFCASTQTKAHGVMQETAALRDFEPAYVRFGSKRHSRATNAKAQILNMTVLPFSGTAQC
jgi:hypothetical protein